MAKQSLAYFRNYPDIVYDGKKAKNIILRSRIKNVLLNRASLFYTYTIQDGDRPDILAFKFYGDVDLDWLILYANDIYDPYFEWPIPDALWPKYIKEKYGSIEYAEQTVKEYRRIVEHRVVNPDGTIVPERSIEVDIFTFNATPVVNRRSLTFAQWERERNDAKREIRILDSRYVPQIVREMGNIYG